MPEINRRSLLKYCIVIVIDPKDPNTKGYLYKFHINRQLLLLFIGDFLDRSIASLLEKINLSVSLIVF